MKPSRSSFIKYLITVQDHIKEAVMLIDIEYGNKFRLLIANRAFHNITGYETGCVGKELSEFISPGRYKILKKQYDKVIQSKQPLEYTTWADVPAGRRAYEIDVIPVLGVANSVVQVIVLARDITKFAKIKEEVQVLRATRYSK